MRTAGGRERHGSAANSLPALAPILAGSLLVNSGFGWPLVICGGLKISYDLLLRCSNIRPPEEADRPMLGVQLRRKPSHRP